MKKTRKQISDTLDQITIVDDNGEELTFLNGVIQMHTGGRFIAAKSPIDGELSLIIEDYAFWHVNCKEIEQWIEDSGGAITQRGMVVHFDTEEDRTMFILRWG
jgi:hypothetical protein